MNVRCPCISSYEREPEPISGPFRGPSPKVREYIQEMRIVIRHVTLFTLRNTFYQLVNYWLFRAFIHILKAQVEIGFALSGVWILHMGRFRGETGFE